MDPLLKKQPVRSVTSNDRRSIRLMLQSYHKEYCGTAGINLPSSSISGLTELIITEVLENLEFVDSASYLLENFSIIDAALADKIYRIICSHHSFSA